MFNINFCNMLLPQVSIHIKWKSSKNNFHAATPSSGHATPLGTVGCWDFFFSYPLYFPFLFVSVSLPYFIPAVVMRKCSGEHSWMSTPFL